jgi:hypothetical protein
MQKEEKMNSKIREKLVTDAKNYFKSDHWNQFLDFHLKNPETEIWHSHIFVETSIHPESLSTIIENYFESKEMGLKRKIDFLTPGPKSGLGALHNIHPSSLPHFDLFFRHNADVGLTPMSEEKGESGKNALSWGKKHIDDFYSQFNFKAIGPKEEAEIRNFFKSRQWKQAVNWIMDPDVIHAHCNVRISFDPKILELIARDELDSQGWTLDKVVPNVFNVRGEYRGKLVFLGNWPEKVYDIGWRYDPNVVIAPSLEPWGRDDCPPGFDLCFTSEFNDLIAQNEYVKLTETEIKEIIE